MIAFVAGLLALIVHAATAGRYGYFRDELYFIACAHHLAWGYVDQPPLVAIAAWLALPAGDSLLALRALPVIAAALTTVVAIAIARDLGGGHFARILTALTVGFMPAYLALGNLLTTSSFEGLSWTLVAWLAIRLARGEDAHTSPRLWIALAFAVAFGLYGKYSMCLAAACFLAGLLLTRERRVLATPWFPLALALSFVLVLPNFIWQLQHGFPFLEVLNGDAAHRHAFNNGLVLESQNLASNTIAYIGEQILYTNPIAVPIWIVGIIAPFAMPSLRRARFVSIAWLLLIAVAVVLEAKGYYTTGIYAALFAIGSVVVERAASWLRGMALACIAVVALVSMPMSIPVLSLQEFLAYSKALGLTGHDGQPVRLIEPLYAEEFGWDRLARDVARVYSSMAPGTRNLTAVYADTYADAGAIDFFGSRYGLPKAISSQNTYWLWGTRGYDGQTLIAIGATRIDILKQYYERCELVATSTEPLKWIVEGPSPIYFCAGAKEPFEQIWQHLRWYGA
ncbi:MAG: glycosyltransferase family 39 protein [Candidatus Eremiobacteraeota bacterium]|nr:glycosyltransferase family 39 protein [Candidatus Eremiobacteraeota bacterium]